MSGKVYQDFWASIDNGKHDNIQGLIFQKYNGKWVTMFADPNQFGRVLTVQVDYNPWTGEKLPGKREKNERKNH